MEAGKGVLYLRGVEKRPVEGEAEDYAFRIPAIARLKRLEFRRPVTFFVGENGSGKSTLLEAIAVAWGFNPEGGSRNFRFASRDTHSGLYRALRLVRSPEIPEDGYFLRAESLYNMASYVDEMEDDPLTPSYLQYVGGKSLHGQSHGESLLALAKNRFWGRGLYLLDEPESALSPMRQLSFLTLMHDLVSRGGQLLIATHSPILMAYPQADILRFDGPDGVERVNYRDTEHYRITREFLSAPERMLSVLLAPEEEEP